MTYDRSFSPPLSAGIKALDILPSRGSGSGIVVWSTKYTDSVQLHNDNYTNRIIQVHHWKNVVTRCNLSLAIAVSRFACPKGIMNGNHQYQSRRDCSVFALIDVFQFIVFFLYVCRHTKHTRYNWTLIRCLRAVSVGCRSLWQLSHMINFQLTIRGTCIGPVKYSINSSDGKQAPTSAQSRRCNIRVYAEHLS